MIDVVDSQFNGGVAGLQAYCAIVGVDGTDAVSKFCSTILQSGATVAVVNAALSALQALLRERAFTQMKGLCVEQH